MGAQLATPCRRTTLNIPEVLYPQIDALVQVLGFKNRTEFILHLVRQVLMDKQSLIMDTKKGGLKI